MLSFLIALTFIFIARRPKYRECVIFPFVHASVCILSRAPRRPSDVYPRVNNFSVWIFSLANFFFFFSSLTHVLFDHSSLSFSLSLAFSLSIILHTLMHHHFFLFSHILAYLSFRILILSASFSYHNSHTLSLTCAISLSCISRS